MTEMNVSEPKHSTLVEDSKKKSAAFVADWKKRTHHTTQTTLQTKSEAFTAWCLTQGWAMKDMRTWTTLCEKAKYSVCDGNVADELKLLLETVDLPDPINRSSFDTDDSLQAFPAPAEFQLTVPGITPSMVSSPGNVILYAHSHEGKVSPIVALCTRSERHAGVPSTTVRTSFSSPTGGTALEEPGSLPPE